MFVEVGVWVALLLACTSSEAPPAPIEPVPAAAEAPALPKPGRAKDQVEPTWKAELGDLDRRLAFFEKRAENPADAVAVGQAVGLLLERAHLTGDYADYTRADQLVQRALAARETTLVHAAAASLDYSLHRYASAEAHLSKSGGDAGLSAAIAFDRGQYAEAGEAYVRLAASEKPIDLSRLAIFRWKTGAIDEAEDLLSRSEAKYFGRSHRARAWVHLQRGLIDLDHGRLDEALVHYRDAEAAMQGYWLIDEHIAEIHLIREQYDEAEKMYRDLVERTGNPEFLDRLADVLAATGREAEAKEVVARARAAYEQRLALFPEATWGHAIDHWLAWGAPEEALRMAEANYTNRPNGEAALARIEALLKVGREADARAALDALRQTPFRSPEVDAIGARLGP